MHITQDGIELIKRFEGVRLEAYRDPKGIPTIGYGHTKGVMIGQKITLDQAESYLKQDIAWAEAKVNDYNYKYHWMQYEFDALVSFAYNIGSITALTKFGTRSRKEIAEKMLQYNKCNGKVLQGLKRRREAEYNMFKNLNKPSYDYEIGKTYTIVASALNVRVAPNKAAKKALSTSYRKGREITVTDVCKDSDGNIWLQFVGGRQMLNKYYVCAVYEGKVYIK